MIGRREEYAKMFQVEQRLWWYRHLHERVLTEIQRHFGQNRTLKILDAGCGTGGMLWFLQQHGYRNLHGIDGSTDAVAFCHERNLSVDLVDLTQLAAYQPDALDYDVIICNDVFCYIAGADTLPLLRELSHRLRPGRFLADTGLLISNNNAFSVFRGRHDVAVGSARRFISADFAALMPAAGLTIRQSTYWSFVLSPVILVIRRWQAWQLRRNPGGPPPVSDVDLPAAWLNEALYRLVRLEQQLLPRTPFGSSLFLTMSKLPAR